MTPRGARFVGLVLALAFGYFLYVRAHFAWIDYWLVTDGRAGTAIVTHEHWSGHNAVGYKYVVDQKEYTGRSSRNSSMQYNRVQPGGESIVYFSASHPWLSSLNKPENFGQPWPIILIVVAFEVFALITIFKPTSSWAFSLTEKNSKP